MSQDDTSKPAPKIDAGVVIHSSAGILALVLGGLMYSQQWALYGFAGLMLVSALSSVIISWRMDAWVPGHWLAMLPVVGVAIGFYGVDWGFTLAYICLWLAFLHFVVRTLQLVISKRNARES